MSHNLAVNADGQAEMCYAGERPWHGLGTELQNPATSAEAIIAAHMDWKVQRMPMKLIDADIPIPRKAAMVRMNATGIPETILGVVGSEYCPMDNTEAFDFFDSIVGAGQAIYHTAGCLDGGKKIWILAKLPNDIMIKGKDRIEKFTLLSTSHDGSGAIQLMHCPNRVVCANTLNIALAEGTDRISIRHTKNAKSKVTLAREVLGVAIQNYRKFEEAANFLVSIQVNGELFLAFLNKVLPIKAGATKVTIDHTNEIRTKVTELFETGKGNNEPETKRTLYTAVNAVAEYSDHFKTVRKESAETRLNSIWFGSSAQMKTEAWDAAIELAKV